MLKTMLKNYFRNLVYISIPMGIFYLFLIIALFSFAFAIVGNVTLAFQEIVTLVKDSVVEAEASAEELFSYAYSQVDRGGNFFATLGAVLTTDWLMDTVNSFMEMLEISTEGLLDGFMTIISNLLLRIEQAFIFSLTLLAISIVIACILTRFVLVRVGVARSLKKKFVELLAYPLATALLFLIPVLLAPVIHSYAVVLLLLFPVLHIFGSLLLSWSLHRGSGIRLRDVVNLKNAGFQLLGMALLVLISVAAFLLLVMLNPWVALLLLIPLLIYTLCIMSINADDYVCSLAAAKGR